MDPPLESEHIHTKCAGAGRHLSSDTSVSNNSERLARDHRYVKRLPSTCHLIANHAPKIFREVQNRSQSKLSQRSTEDAAAIGQDHVTIDQLGEKRLFQTGRSGMNPA